ncbi:MULTISPECIES: YdeI family protein [unclassified Curtobacterium]|uniref:YdeI/OmpD-associated family protein n=1 Tax=unclassified Curtobacterium TaxID=257496 RepID=UPI001C64E030|nr:MULTISPECIES: YdeI/OmpD-associated family protein [unclassified Curtobacterium]WIB35989.1 YdeI/OmpD-associated family protein [Curtobacterium sp. MCJR17_043]
MEIEPFVVADAAAWRAWLDGHEDTSDGVWLVLAKKGTTSPTSLTYAQALDEALCSGWIDGSKRGLDAATFLQRFTPRRKASLWSKRNVGLVAALVEAGRMRPRGQAEVDRAKDDGRWDRAYAGAATAEVPEDLRAALDAAPTAAALFAELDATNRYAVVHRVVTAPSETARANRIAKLVGGLTRGETPYPRPGAQPPRVIDPEA